MPILGLLFGFLAFILYKIVKNHFRKNQKIKNATIPQDYLLSSPIMNEFFTEKTSLISPDKKYRFAFRNFEELLKEGNTVADCYLNINEKKQIFIHKRCSSAPLWNSEGTKALIPVWVNGYKWKQRFLIVDFTQSKIIKYKMEFSDSMFLDFDKDIVYYFDKGSTNKTVNNIEINKAIIDSIKQLDL